MNPAPAQSWTERNDAYLSAALEWLRARLRRMAAMHAKPEIEDEVKTPQHHPAHPWLIEWLFGPAHSPMPKRPRKAEPSPSVEELDRAVVEAASRMSEAEQMEPPPALSILTKRFELSRFERDVLLLCVAMELDTRMGDLCAHAQGHAALRSPTFALGLALFDEAAWDSMSPERPLRFWRLVEISQAGAQPLTAAPLRADERTVNYVKGLNDVDDRLTAILTPFAPAADLLPPSQESVVDAIVSGVRGNSDPPLVHLMGADVHSKQWIARRVSQTLKLTLMKLSADALPPGITEAENLARLWQRECALCPLALYLDAQDADRELPVVNRFLSRTGGLVFLGTRDAVAGLAHESLGFDVTKPTRREQRDVWRRILGRARETEAATLAAQFNFSMADIERIARQSLGADQKPDRARLWNLCLLSARPQLDTLAQRVEAKADWDALVIADQERTMLMQIASQVRSRMTVYDDWGFASRMNRGMGLTALFAGESGTRETMAASHRQRTRAQPAPNRSVQLWSTSTSARPKRICAECSTPLKMAARFSFSTKRMPCSASAAKSRTATIATPTSK